MRTCSYCGKEYPDDATVCAIDGQALTNDEQTSGDPAGRNTIKGVWRGAYGYAEPEMRAGRKPVPFTLKLKQGWFGHFTGTVTEDAPEGMPGTGVIEGYFGSPTIEFTKQMPIGYTTGSDGRRMTLREYIIGEGHECEHDLPSAPISYEGTFLETNRVQGTWIIYPHQIPLPDGQHLAVSQTSGVWCAEFITTDIKVNPTGGPIEPFFDKSLLPQPEPDDAKGTAFRRMGRFNVADAGKLLKRFEQANVRFEINSDDAPIRQMMPFAAVTGGYSGTAPMVEIFVHPNDEAKAVEIMNEDNKV